MTVPGQGGSRLRSAVWALGAGTLAGLALPPFGMPPLLWPALAVLWQLASGSRRGATLLWGLAAVLTSHRWLLWLHPLDWIGVPAALSLPLCLLIWLACGLLGGALVLLWSLPWSRLGLERADTALLAAGVWGLAEVLLARGPLFWIGLGVSPLPGDRPLAGLGAIGGAGLIATVQLLIGWGLWRVSLRRPPWRRSLLGLLVLVLVAHLLGAVALKPAQDLWRSAGERQTLLVLQPAIPTREKFKPAQQRRLLETLNLTLERLSAGDTTEEAAAQPTALNAAHPAAPTAANPTGGTARAQPAPRTLSTPAFGAAALAGYQPLARDVSIDPSATQRRARVDAVLLPEGALPLDQPLPRSAPVEVLSGGFRRQGEGLRSALLRFPPGERWAVGGVDKHRLVPLGEWVPLSGLLRWSGLSAVGGLEPGTASRLLNRPGGRIGVAICYELADGQALAQASREGAEWLLASANLDPYPQMLQQQYAAVAQLRAIETGRWLVSAANTGPSLLVDPAGRLRGKLEPLSSSQGLAQLQRLQRQNLHLRLGELPLLTLLLIASATRARALLRQGNASQISSMK